MKEKNFSSFPEYSKCRVCPKNCGINRNAGITGFCGETSGLKIAWAGLHFGEEPPVSGTGGSGTVFITGCNLRCAFCQNRQISREGMGRTVEREEFADICLALQEKGAENINIVTGTHAAPAITAFLKEAVNRGLSVPVVWNTSAYETSETLEALSEVVNIWLPDIKTLNAAVASAAFKCPDYPETACRAVLKMAELSKLKFAASKDKTACPSDKITSGVIVRHLALPGKIEESGKVIEWFASHLKEKAILSLMTQYTPVPSETRTEKRESAKNLPFEQRFINRHEDNRLKQFLCEYGIEDGFYQELAPGSGWLPDFKKIMTFSSALSVPVWHWQHRFIKH